MRIIKGYVCVGKISIGGLPGESVLFGRQVNSAEAYENFMGNGFQPFEIITDAEKVMRKLAKGVEFNAVILANLEMNIARSGETRMLERPKNRYVVVDYGKKNGSIRDFWGIIGPRTAGVDEINKTGGAYITQNGLTCFQYLCDAIGVARKLKEMGLNTSLASFKHGSVAEIQRRPRKH